MTTYMPAPIPLTVADVGFATIGTVQPFSPRAGIGYQDLLETLRLYIQNDLYNFLTATNPQDVWNANVDALVAAVNLALTNYQTEVDTALTNKLNDIASGADAALNDAVIKSALQSNGSQALAYLVALFAPKPTAFGHYLLTGAGMDPSGATDSTVAINTFLAALPDGCNVVVPSGAIYVLSDTVQLPHRVHLSGDGELRWTSGIASKPMVHVTVDGTNLDGLYCTNPNHLAAQQPATRTYGVYIEANSVRVSGCRIVGQQQAICVSASGEYRDTIITNNIILDVPGSGDGAASGSSNGEDRGDGIIVWGATAVITGNRVVALTGTDARVGIHTEALPGAEGTAYVHGDSHTVIANNIVTGKFRRSITSEGVAFCTIIGNTVADATWWSINLSNLAYNCVVADNVINWTRTSTDNQGSAYSPVRGGIMIYDQVQNSKVKGNIITVASGAVMTHGIIVQASANDVAHKSQNISIEGNRITDPAWGISSGINIPNGATATRILNNDIDGFTANGVNCQSVDDVSIVGNRLLGNSASITAKGVLLQNTSGSGTWAKVNENIISYTTTALALYNRTVFITAVANIIRQATTGIDFFGSSSAVTTSNSNTFIATTTKQTNLPTTNVQIGNN